MGGLSEGSIQRRIVSMAVDDEGFVKAFTRRSKEVSERIDKVQAELDQISKSPEADRLSDVIGEARKKYQASREDLMKRKKAGENIQSRVADELIPAMEAYLQTIDRYADYTREVLQTARREAEAEAQTTRSLVLGLMLLATALGCSSPSPSPARSRPRWRRPRP